MSLKEKLTNFNEVPQKIQLMTKTAKQESTKKFRQALNYLISGNFPEAIKLAIEIAEDNIHYFEYMMEAVSKRLDESSAKDPKKSQEFIAETLDKLSSQPKNMVLKQWNKNVCYYYFFLGFLYTKTNDKKKALGHYQLAVHHEKSFALGYLYQIDIYLEKADIENALKSYWSARDAIESAVAFNASLFLNEKLSKYLSRFTDSPCYQTSTHYFDEQIKLREDLIAGFELRSQIYQKKGKLKKSQADTLTANDQLKYLSVTFSRRAQYYQHVEKNYQAALNDYAKAIETYSGPFYYFACGEIHWTCHQNYLQAAKYFQKSLIKDQNLINKYPEEEINIEETLRDNKTKIPESFFEIMTLLDLKKEACKATKSLPEFIVIFNQHVITINQELEKLNSKDQMEEIKLLEELKQATQAGKNSAELVRIYNKHVDKINKKLKSFGLKTIQKLAMPTLVSLAGLVVAKSDLFKTNKVEIYTKITTGAENSPLNELINYLKTANRDDQSTDLIDVLRP